MRENALVSPNPHECWTASRARVARPSTSRSWKNLSDNPNRAIGAWQEKQKWPRQWVWAECS